MTEYIFGQIEVEAIENPSYQLQITTHYCPPFPLFCNYPHNNYVSFQISARFNNKCRQICIQARAVCLVAETRNISCCHLKAR